MLRWKFGLVPRESPSPTAKELTPETLQLAAPDLPRLHNPAPSQTQLTWIGHSTFLIQHHGQNSLTDPIFGDCLTPIPGVRLRQSTLKPVRLMQSAASHINAGNLSERIPAPPGDGEMAGLARLLNQMFDRLENSFQPIKRSTADTSHELMTPLSIIRLHAERMRNQAELPEAIRHLLDEQLQEVTHLTETLEKLKVLTKADASALQLKLVPSATDEFIANFAEDAQLLAESKGYWLLALPLCPGPQRTGGGEF